MLLGERGHVAFFLPFLEPVSVSIIMAASEGENGSAGGGTQGTTLTSVECRAVKRLENTSY